MGMRNIVKLGDEALRKTCKPMQKFDLRLWLLLRDMADTMYKANGVGLAAPQVGILKRVVVVDIGDGLIEMINPEIIHFEGEQTGPEGCLSVPGRSGVVTRPNIVTVRYQNREGDEYEATAEGFLARAFCHEIDHLHGTLYVDKMDREIFPDDPEYGSSDDDEEEEE